MSAKTVVIICGPTAVGKTALAIQLAQHFKTKIVSADSRQCFKELNVGVAKPTAEELGLVQHYFINSHSIHQELNAVVFEQYALNAVAEIFQENNVAIMVGGTGLYIKAFCEGLDQIPQIPENIREGIKKNYQEKGLAWLQQQIQEKDPEFWQIAEQQNAQRLQRALEVFEATQQSITKFRVGEQQQRSFNIIKLGLNLPREILYNRINTRVLQMLQEGLVEEVKSLIPYQTHNALQTVGYREFFTYFNQQVSLEKAIDEVQKNTRHYAKRQITWFKKDAQINWFEPTDFNAIVNYLEPLLG